MTRNPDTIERLEAELRKANAILSSALDCIASAARSADARIDLAELHRRPSQYDASTEALMSVAVTVAELDALTVVAEKAQQFRAAYEGTGWGWGTQLAALFDALAPFSGSGGNA